MKNSTKQPSKTHEELMREIDERINKIKEHTAETNTAHEEIPIPKPKWYYKFFKKNKPAVTATEFTPPRDKLTNIKDRFRKEKSWLIHMRLRQGGTTSFIINTDQMEFEYCKGRYIIDSSMSDYNHGAGYFELTYHQDFCLPLRQNVNMKELRDAIELYGSTTDLEVENNTNPMELKKWEEGKIAEQVFKGSAFDDFMRMESLKTWIILALVAIMIILFVAKTGMLKSISIPGL